MCVFKHINGSIIVIYVDDIIIVSDTLAVLNYTTGLVKERFKMRELSDLHYYLGMRIIRNRTNRTVYVV